MKIKALAAVIAALFFTMSTAQAAGNTSTVAQAGIGNAATTTQTAGPENVVTVTQTGDNNGTNLMQSGGGVGVGNTATINQIPDPLVPLSISDNNTVGSALLGANAAQTGTSGTVTVNQIGTFNATDYIQSGDSNSMTVNQTGNLNVANINQSGGGPVPGPVPALILPNTPPPPPAPGPGGNTATITQNNALSDTVGNSVGVGDLFHPGMTVNTPVDIQWNTAVTPNQLIIDVGPRANQFGTNGTVTVDQTLTLGAAVGNVTDYVQSGDSNTIDVSQNGSGLIANISQDGSWLPIPVIGGANSNRARIIQTGINNKVGQLMRLAAQEGQTGLVTVDQSGSGNWTDYVQQGAFSTATIIQRGTNGRIDVNQFAATNKVATVTQNASTTNSYAGINQNPFGSNSTATIEQLSSTGAVIAPGIGYTTRAEIWQAGPNDWGKATQSGDSNILLLFQNADTTQSIGAQTVAPFDVTPFMVVQGAGNDNRATSTQSGDNNLGTISQQNTFAVATLVQQGITAAVGPPAVIPVGNTATISQAGAGTGPAVAPPAVPAGANTVDVFQYGDGNIATATQELGLFGGNSITIDQGTTILNTTGNTATAIQTATATTGNIITISQLTDGNTATATQSGGAGNIATINQ